jgi:hypothetical protein
MEFLNFLGPIRGIASTQEYLRRNYGDRDDRAERHGNEVAKIRITRPVHSVGEVCAEKQGTDYPQHDQPCGAVGVFLVTTVPGQACSVHRTNVRAMRAL